MIEKALGQFEDNADDYYEDHYDEDAESEGEWR
jgi:hypothetical protein